MSAFVPAAIVILMLFFPSWAPAGNHVNAGDHLVLAARDHQGHPGQDNRDPRQVSPRIGGQQAAALVKRRYREGKILAVNLIDRNGSPVYRVKVLSTEGVVKYVFVDGTRGRVFE